MQSSLHVAVTINVKKTDDWEVVIFLYVFLVNFNYTLMSLHIVCYTFLLKTYYSFLYIQILLPLTEYLQYYLLPNQLLK